MRSKNTYFQIHYTFTYHHHNGGGDGEGGAVSQATLLTWSGLRPRSIVGERVFLPGCYSAYNVRSRVLWKQVVVRIESDVIGYEQLCGTWRLLSTCSSPSYLPNEQASSARCTHAQSGHSARSGTFGVGLTASEPWQVFRRWNHQRDSRTTATRFFFDRGNTRPVHSV